MDGSVISGAATAAPDETERRVHLRLRAVFDEAIERVAPFFDRRNAWSDADLEHCAYRTMREHYPELTAEEVYVFVVAARRVFAARRATRA